MSIARVDARRAAGCGCEPMLPVTMAIRLSEKTGFWTTTKAAWRRGGDADELRPAMPSRPVNMEYREGNLPMNSSIASRLFSPLKAKVCASSHRDVTSAAEAELAAFYHAVRANHGTEKAAAATEHWLRAFGSTSIDRNNLEMSFRKITVAAASMLAAEITEKPLRTAHSFLGEPCPAASISGCR